MLSLIPAACAALICAAPSAAAAPLSPGTPALIPVIARVFECLPPNASRGASGDVTRRGGPIGWLLRHARDEDEIERPRLAAPISYYLRSPLLTSFFGPLPCPNAEKKADGEAGAG